jgi:hypothetical protein
LSPAGPLHGLEFPSSTPWAPGVQPQAPLRTPSPTASPRVSATQSAASNPQKIDANLKRQIIADFKKRIDSVLGQVRDVTGNFREIDRLDQARPLLPTVSGEVTVLANEARQFRAELGYEVTFYECLSEIETVDGLVVVDEVTRDLAANDAPSARNTLVTFRNRYSEPTAENYKPLWRYLVSIFSTCDRLKTEAETHLQKALSLESAGKKGEALKQYREINKIYPNPLTTEKIRQLESQPR